MILIYSDISLRGHDLDPDTVTSALGGLQPTDAGRRGSPKSNGRPREQGWWWFAPFDAPRSTIADSLDDLFARLDAAWPALVVLGTVYQIDIDCCVKIYDGSPDTNPYYGFERRHVRRAADLMASLAIDDYDFRGTGAQPDD